MQNSSTFWYRYKMILNKNKFQFAILQISTIQAIRKQKQ